MAPPAGTLDSPQNAQQDELPPGFSFEKPKQTLRELKAEAAERKPEVPEIKSAATKVKVPQGYTLTDVNVPEGYTLVDQGHASEFMKHLRNRPDERTPGPGALDKTKDYFTRLATPDPYRTDTKPTGTDLGSNLAAAAHAAENAFVTFPGNILRRAAGGLGGTATDVLRGGRNIAEAALGNQYRQEQVTGAISDIAKHPIEATGVPGMIRDYSHNEGPEPGLTAASKVAGDVLQAAALKGASEGWAALKNTLAARLPRITTPGEVLPPESALPGNMPAAQLPPPSTPIPADDLGGPSEPGGGGGGPTPAAPEAAPRSHSTGGAFQPPQTGGAQTLAETGKAVLTQELEESLLDRVTRHTETQAALKRDLEGIPPEDHPAILAAIDQSGLEAYTAGDYKAALEAAHNHILLEQVIRETEARAAAPAVRPTPPAAEVPEAAPTPETPVPPQVAAPVVPPATAQPTPATPEQPGGYVAGIAKKAGKARKKKASVAPVVPVAPTPTVAAPPQAPGQEATPPTLSIGKYSMSEVRKALEQALEGTRNDPSVTPEERAKTEGWLKQTDEELFATLQKEGATEKDIADVLSEHGKPIATPEAPPPAPATGIGKYSLDDVRAIYKAVSDHPSYVSSDYRAIYRRMSTMFDDDLLNKMQALGIGEENLDQVVKELGIKLPSTRAVEAAPAPSGLAAPPPAVGPTAPALTPEQATGALTSAGLHDPSTSRVVGRAVKQGQIASQDQLDQIVKIANAIKALDPKTANIAAIHEAIRYGGMQGLENTATYNDPDAKLYMPEVIARAKQVLDAVKKPPKIKQTKKPKAAQPQPPPPEAAIDVAFARTAGGKIKIGADPKALAEVLGSSLYGKDHATVITKELMQNAWDAIRRSSGQKEVTVAFDRYDKKIVISDTGQGMTRKELETVFTDLGASGKRSQADASGGFGIAKAAPFMMTKQLTVTTITNENGKFYKHSFTSTPDSIVGKGVDILTEELPGDGYYTGTVIEAELPQDAGMWTAQEFARRSKLSLHPPGNLVVTGMDRDWVDTTPLSMVTTAKVPGAKVTLHASTDRQKAQKWESIKVEVNNNGIYQFDMDVYPPTEGMQVPRRIAVDIKATVKERDKDYPFMANREDFGGSGNIKSEIQGLIKKHIFEAAVKSHNQEIADAMRGLPFIKVGATEIPIFDSGKRLTEEEMEQLKRDPAFIDLAYTINKVTHDAIDKLQTEELPYNLKDLGKRVRRVGIVFSDKLHGVHIADPLDTQYALLFINPFQNLKGNSARAASTIWHTIKHELIHDQVSGHNEDFTMAEGAVAGALGSTHELAAMQELEDVYGDPTDPGGIRSDLGSALQLYAFSRVREQTVPDIFRGEGLAVERPEGRETGVRDGGSSVVPEGGNLDNPNILLDVEKPAAPVWFLKSERVIGDKMRGPMQGPDVLNMLRNNGVSPDELKWTGLDDYLPGAGKVTPEQVRNYISQNGIKVQEVSKGVGGTVFRTDFPSKEELMRVVQGDEMLVFPWNGELRPGLSVTQTAGGWNLFDAKVTGEDKTKFGAPNLVLPGGENYRELLLTMPPRPPQLSVGPMEPIFGTGEAMLEGRHRVQGVTEAEFEINNEKGRITYWPNRFDWQGSPKPGGYVVNSVHLQNAWFDTLDAAKQFIVEHASGGRRNGEGIPRADLFRTSHWDDEPNVLMHVRMNDRTAPDGKKLLHIEEVQSDWHQKGRKQGYRSPRAAELEKQMDAIRKRYDDIEHPVAVDTVRNIREWRRQGKSDDEIDRMLTELDAARGNPYLQMQVELAPLQDELRKEMGGVPDAPFKKNWQEVALRRMVRYAAENGYDGISWTGGADQADRYDLSKQVSRITYAPVDGTLKAYDLNGNPLITQNVDRDKLPDHIGKDAADKLLQTPRVDPDTMKTGDKAIVERHGDQVEVTLHPQRRLNEGTVRESVMVTSTDGRENSWYEELRNLSLHKLSGVDLKIGGEGMHGFYDKIVPEYLNKFGKKFGARVERTRVSVGELSATNVFEYDGPERTREELSEIYKEIKDGKRANTSLAEGTNFVNRSYLAPTITQIAAEMGKGHSFGDAVSAVLANNKPLIENFAKELGGTVRQKRHRFASSQYLPITPAMRDSVLKEGVSLFNLERGGGTPARPMPMAPAESQRQRSNVLRRETLPGAKEFQAKRYRNWAETQRVQTELAAIDTEEAALRRNQSEPKWSLPIVRPLHKEMDALNKRRKELDRLRLKLKDEAEKLDTGLDPNVGEVRLDTNGDPTIYLNKTGMGMMRNVIRPGQEDIVLKGQAMTAGEAQWLKNRIMMGGAANGDEAKVFPAVMRLMDAAINQAGNAGITVIGKTGKGTQDAIGTLREELIHRWQRKRSQDGLIDTHLKDEAFTRLHHEMPAPALDYLSEHGYVGRTAMVTAQIQVIEGAAKIMANKWRSMGLNADQAADWLARYYEEVAEQHGIEAVLEVEHTFGMARDFQQELEKIYGPKQGPGTSGADSGRGQLGAANEGTRETKPAAPGAGGTLSSVERGGQGQAEGDAGADAGRDRGVEKPLLKELKSLRPAIAQAAQRIYDEWEQDEEGLDEELGAGGICDQIAQEISGLVSSKIGDAEIEDAGWDGDDHAWLVVRKGGEAYEVDIPPSIYERGGGYSWSKVPDVKFSPEHIYISPIPYSGSDIPQDVEKKPKARDEAFDAARK